MSRLVLVEASDDLLVTMDEARSHLNVSFNEHDLTIERMLRAATSHVERWLGMALLEQTWDYYVDAFPDNDEYIQIPMPPLIEVTEFVSPVTSDSPEEQFTGYSVDYSHYPARIYLPTAGVWPTVEESINAGRIRFRAGYENSEDVPSDIICAILLTLGNLYANRETVVIGSSAVEIPWGAKDLLRQHRVELSIA
jgi:uncharacterized phiE125 gp8 family phage protein